MMLKMKKADRKLFDACLSGCHPKPPTTDPWVGLGGAA